MERGVAGYRSAAKPTTSMDMPLGMFTGAILSVESS
jgi:hypothetical protein